MKFLLYEIIPRAGFNLAAGRFWPAGRMFDTPDLTDKRTMRFNFLAILFHCQRSTIFSTTRNNSANMGSSFYKFPWEAFADTYLVLVY